ncbi:MAG TPA: FGGY family carbohydrate kinase, partial [Solirubrobacterales bacterium]|nr:FGGY family carbohydrate kinase [Solirubrobacterales bacterium]
MSDGMLLGIDEGTTGVKAALFDQRLQPVAEARRDKVNRHPEEGWVEQDGEEVIAVVTEAVAELLDGADGEVAACGLDHQGESVLAWDAETGKPLSPIVVWQDKRSQEILDELADREDEVRELSGLPFDPYFSAAKLAWLLRHNEDVKRARDEGRLRMGTVDSFLCDRLGAGFATDASTASRTQLHALGTPGFSERLCEIFGVPMEVLPEVRDTAGELGTLKHESWPVELPLRGQVVDQQAALAGAACVEPGRVKATYGTGVFVLAHVGEGVPEPAGGLLPTVAWSIDGRVEYALDGGVFAAGAMLEWMCNQLGIAESPPALSELARAAESSAGARVLPGLAGIGAPWWRPSARAVLSGIYGGTTRENVARAALEGIAWRVADVVAAIKETAPVETLRVDGGLTNEPLLLHMQADMIGAPVEAAGADATVLGAAALGGVGAGVIGSVTDLPEMLPADRRVDPERDQSWRSAEHERWREFVRA